MYTFVIAVGGDWSVIWAFLLSYFLEVCVVELDFFLVQHLLVVACNCTTFVQTGTEVVWPGKGGRGL